MLLKDLATEQLLVRNGTKWEWTLREEAQKQRPVRLIAERIDAALTRWGYADHEGCPPARQRGAVPGASWASPPQREVAMDNQIIR